MCRKNNEMNLTKANLAQLHYLARFTPYREEALKEIERRIPKNETKRLSISLKEDYAISI